MDNIYMSRGASKVVNTCAKIQAGEQVLIVTELSRLSIAQALAAEVYRVGAEPAICIMEPRKQDGEEPPKEIAAAMKASDAFLSVVGTSTTMVVDGCTFSKKAFLREPNGFSRNK